MNGGATSRLSVFSGLVFAVLAIGCAALAWGAVQGGYQFILIGAAATCLTISLGILLDSLRQTARHKRAVAMAETVVAHDAAYCFVCNEDGLVLAENAASRKAFVGAAGGPLSDRLTGLLANPEGVLYRIARRALAEGYAFEDITSHAERVQIHSQRLAPGLLLWRMESDATRGESVVSLEQPLMSIGRNGAILYMNAAARTLLGRRAKNLSEVIEDLPLRPGGIHQCDAAQGTRDVLVQSRESSVGRSELTLTPIIEPERSAKMETGEAGTFQTLPVPLLRVRADGTILDANREARRLLDLSSAGTAHIADYMEGLGRALSDWLGEAAEGRGTTRSEFLRLTRADRELFVQVTLKRVIEDGEPVLIAVLNDATELKTLEAQFVQSQKMQAIGQLAGGVAHDFNNLLTAISGHCDLLLLRHDQGDPDYGDLVQINQNANRAAALVGQLLAFSRKQTMRPEILDLRDTMADLTHLLNRLVGEKVQLSLNHDPILPHIRGDRRQLEQVMMNLIVNARDAMPDGGVIEVETERLVVREKMLRDRAVVPPGTYVSVRISDQGCGIPPDKVQKVFEPFFTTKGTTEGTGLGLSTVYGIVKQSGGFVFVDSVVGQGTCFTLLFPAHDLPAEQKPAVPSQDEPRKLPERGSGVVLLVEDEAPVRAFAARALRLRGYTVIEAETAEDALETLEDETLMVDVFVTDVVMPGMDGPSWVRKARKTRPDVRVVFVSGYTEDAFGEGHEEIPNSVFLPKPFSLTELTETVHQQVA
ncbi:hybrid sensor histidine kinase/response regulator [Thalassococcus lentus]|uniref:histidine kinase n=1 Tax=Thalassococcus lentus TaxID=1210524 RepID=A0ABT4XQK5_9RHOB|nr:ATP-binding protein [Thalassococcus lentus]MDA7424227.1 ATP-binding protein [Thalassococcus lentus]